LAQNEFTYFLVHVVVAAVAVVQQQQRRQFGDSGSRKNGVELPHELEYELEHKL
jgi:hypothetical protein